MATLVATYGFHFASPVWLLAAGLVVPVVWLGRRSLAQLGRGRRWAAIALRALVVLVLAATLARPTVTRTHNRLTVIAVLDRSLSVPPKLQQAALAYLPKAMTHRRPDDQLAVVDAAEVAMIARLPSTDMTVPQRSYSLTGQQSCLADGVQLAMAVAPPETAVRILLVSDGNETAGDLRAAARIAAANSIPIDVLPLQYRHSREVIFKRLVAPPTARSGETVPLRFVLGSTSAASGRLMLSVNGRAVDLDPDSAAMEAPVRLQPGTNVKTVSLPVGSRGVHRFVCTFIPDDPSRDVLAQNNRAGGMTYVAGPGHVLVAGSAEDARHVLAKLRAAKMDARECPPGHFPESLTELLGTDALVLVNVDSSQFTYRQQEMICRYVTELGGGLVMVGGPNAFGAGGWIGSPVAEILPVDPDPPQKKQMPKGALVLIMHACEMPRGNYWGKQVAMAAVKVLSRLDLVGVLDYSWQGDDKHWVYPLSPVGGRTKAIAAIQRMEMGDMPAFQAPMEAAYDALVKSDAVQKHVIIISDGDPAAPTAALLKKYKQARITCTGVEVFPHIMPGAQQRTTLQVIAGMTGGQHHLVTRNPNLLPQIVVKEAQVVRRALVVEETFTPRVVNPLSEVVKGVRRAPPLDGYVLTGPKGGLTQLVMTTDKGEPILATGQMGLGRSVAFTSGASTRWAKQWVSGWGGYQRFWEQTVRWAGKPAQEPDCEVFVDVLGREVTITLDAVDAAGDFVQFAHVAGQTIAPDMQTKDLALSQVGPGRYRARFRAGGSGSYLVNLRYQRTGAEGKTGMVQAVATVPYAPEFRDLSDDSALLSAVAQTTGGRVLQADAEAENLFERTGLQFPRTAMPLSKHLFIGWLALFLVDVACRRIAVDFRALARRAGAVLARLRPRRLKAEGTLERLRSRTRQVRRQLSGRGAEPLARRRYDKAEEGAPPLPMSGPPDAEAAEPETPEPPEPAETKPATHVDRLLRAKRQAEDRRKEGP